MKVFFEPVQRIRHEIAGNVWIVAGVDDPVKVAAYLDNGEQVKIMALRGTQDTTHPHMLAARDHIRDNAAALLRQAIHYRAING